jgi:ketosteroid isomerase-like protein
MRILQAKPLLVILLVGSRLAVSAQQDVARAEQAFATMSADSGARTAFLHFLDSNSLLFNEGKGFDGLRFWRGMPGGGGAQLVWKPVYTGMSTAGDLGFSTGPFEQRDAPAGNIQLSGNYSSIWVKNKPGEWKVIIDMGTSYPNSLYQQSWAPVVYNKLLPPATKINWQQVENDIIAQVHQKGYQALLPYLTSDSWFNMVGHQPLHTVNDIEQGLKQIPAGLQFEWMGGAISSSGDLFYAYGSVTLHGKTENYLRVWGHEKDGWKLLLQVLKWAQ